MPKKKGISKENVLGAIYEIEREGQSPTIERIRNKIGGSPNTIHAYLSQWREEQKELEGQEVELSDYTVDLFDKLKQAIGHEANQLAAATADNLRGELEQVKAELEQMCSLATTWENQNQELHEQLDQIQNINNRLEAVNDQLQNELKAERQTRIEIEKKIAVLEYENTRIAQELKQERQARIESEKLLASIKAEHKS